MIIDSLKERRDCETQFSDTSSISKIDDCFQRTSRDLSSHKQHIKVFRDQFRHDLNIEIFILRFLKISEKQIIVLKFHTQNLNDCQRVFVKRNNRERFSNIVVCFNDVIIVRDCRKFHFIRLIKKLKKAKSKAKREIAKIVKNLFNQRLISTAKNVVVKLKSMFDEMIARVVVDEIELTQFEKENEALFESEAEEEQQKLTSNENLSDLNIMKYFYLNMIRSANVNEVNYISSFKFETDLKRRFQYNLDFLSSSLSTRRREISLSFIVYEHDYIEAEARDML